MGQDKALLPLGCGTLIEQLAMRVAEVAGNVALVGAPDRYRHLSFDRLSDGRPGMGPLAGIEAALESGRGTLNLIVACDMPALETDWLRRLLLRAKQSEALCVVGCDVNGIHPTCAVYRSNCLPLLREALDAGHLKLLDFVAGLSPVTVESDSPIWNINTAEEWKRFQDAQFS